MDIKELRKQLKMTQHELADKLGVDTRTVNRWENGKARPSQLARRQLDRLARRVKEDANNNQVYK